MERKANESVSLKDWYDNLPAKDQVKMRDRVVEACGISTKTFYNWKNNQQIPGLLAQKEIIAIAGQEIDFNGSTLVDNLQLVK